MPEADPDREGGRPPPLRLPGQHFAAALLFLVLGGAGLAWRSGALAAGAFPDPGLQAAAHLLTLGWISTSIMGVLYHFAPMSLGSSVRWVGAAHLGFWAWTAGLLAFTGGLVGGLPVLYLAGAGLLGAGILLFVTNLASTLARTEQRGLTWWCLAGAATSLVGAWVLGALLAASLATGLLGTSRFPVLVVHLHVAAGGWVLLTMIGVGHRLLPMSLWSTGTSDRAGRAAAWLVALGTGGLLLSEHLLPVGVIRPALWLLAAGTAAFVLQAALHYRRRGRPRLDPALRLAAGSLVLLGLAAAAGVVALLSASPGGRLFTAYGVLLLPGGLGLFVAAHYFRIPPALVWFHRFRPVAGEREVPQAGELLDRRAADLASALLLAGVAGTAAGVLAGSPGLCRAGGLAFATGAAAEAAVLFRLARRRPGRTAASGPAA